jgi:hypothetical protein
VGACGGQGLGLHSQPAGAVDWPYDRMNEAYNAIDRWMAASQRESAGQSWEIYGDPTPDPAHTETTVVRLLK